MDSIMLFVAFAGHMAIVLASLGMGWLMRLGDRLVRRYSGMAFFWMLALVTADATRVMVVDDVPLSWWTTLARVVLGTVAVTFAASVYTDLGGTQRPTRSRAARSRGAPPQG